MIYYSQGLKSAIMTETKPKDPIEWLKSSVQPMRPGESPEEFKQNRALYFISGKMTARDGRVRRNNQNMIERDLLVIDIDDGQDHETVAERLAIAGYEAFIYPTPRYQEDAQRFKVVLRADKPITTPESHTATMATVANVLGGQFDPSSATWSQMQSAPIRKEGAFEPVHLDGEPFPVTDKLSESATMPLKCHDEPARDRTPIARAEALDIMARYVKRDSDMLIDRENYLSALMAIILAVQTGEIDQETGEQCAVMLAGNNEEWKAGNLEQFRYEVHHTVVSQDKTFREKFDWKPDMPPVEELFEVIDEQVLQNDDKIKTFEDDSIAASELATKKYDPIVFYVEDLITPGLTVIAAPPKAGKSWYALAMQLSIATGESFHGRNTKRTKVLYCALEDSQRRVKSRLMTLDPLIAEEDLDNLFFVFKVPRLQVPGADGRIREKLTPSNDFLTYLEHKWMPQGVKVVVVDVFQKIRSGTGNRNTYEAEYAEGGRLQSFARNHGICLVVLHHFKKGTQGQDPVERIGGSTGFTGSADTLITIEFEDRNNLRSTFTVTGRDVPMQEFECEFEDGIWSYTGTVEQNRAIDREAQYNKHPIVKTIKHELAGKDEFKTTATDLKNKMLELYGWEADGITVDKRSITRLQNDLYLYDQISYKHTRESGARWHVFKKNRQDDTQAS